MPTWLNFDLACSLLIASFIYMSICGRKWCVQCFKARLFPRCIWTQVGKSPTMSNTNEDVEYQRAVTALNGLQTPANVLGQKKSAVDVEPRRNDCHKPLNKESKIQHMQDFLERSGIQLSDLNKLNAIHITGTKGKGSVCAMCEIILRKHKLKTGFFSSPHLLEVRERIRLDGIPLSKAKFVSYFWECFNELEKTKEKMPTYFKFLTVMAFYVFLKEKVDVAIIEVGIGGTYDCTNVLPNPTVCAISSLGYDHMEVLGDTLEKISWQKGGICKPGRPAFTSPQFPGPMGVLAERASELGASSLEVAPPLVEYPSVSPPLRLGLAGNHQYANASLAVQVCRAWLRSEGIWPQDGKDAENATRKQLHGVNLATPFMLTQEFQEGLEKCSWPGRNQVIRRGRVTYYLDGAHTPQSIKSCAEWFKSEAKKESQLSKESFVRVLLFNVTKKRDPKLLMQGLVDCGFSFAAFTPNIAGTNLADQANLMVTVDSQCAYAHANHRAWLEVNHCVDDTSTEPIQQRYQHIATSSPDPLTICTGGVGHNGTILGPRFEQENARVFTCISDVLKWCDGDAAPSPELATPPGLAAPGRVQILVTGSLHLVGATMSVLGCKVEDL